MPIQKIEEEEEDKKPKKKETKPKENKEAEKESEEGNIIKDIAESIVSMEAIIRELDSRVSAIESYLFRVRNI